MLPGQRNVTEETSPAVYRASISRLRLPCLALGMLLQAETLSAGTKAPRCLSPCSSH